MEPSHETHTQKQSRRERVNHQPLVQEHTNKTNNSTTLHLGAVIVLLVAMPTHNSLRFDVPENNKKGTKIKNLWFTPKLSQTVNATPRTKWVFLGGVGVVGERRGTIKRDKERES